MGVLRRGDRWYVKWKDAAGIWRRKATTARTRAEAQALWHSLSEQAQRQRDGLAPRPVNNGLTLWALCAWWVESKCPELSRRRAENQLRVHVERESLGQLPLLAITPEVLDDFFARRVKEGYAPRTINQLRAWLRSVFSRAKKARLWMGDNPVAMTEKIEVPASIRPTLEAHEVPRMLAQVREPWRAFMAIACFLGLRKGEICGLRKADYDAVRRTLYVGRSYSTEFTKTKRADTLPVSSTLATYLDEALKTPGPWLCPREGGAQRNEECSPEDNLRSALRRAGIITGWEHKCRRCARQGESTVVEAQDDEKRSCPKCGFTLWPVATPKPLVFHDLRHTCATLLLRDGVPVQHVMRVLRHSNISTTVNTYGHLLTEDLRPFVENIGSGPRPVQAPTLKVVTSNQ